MMNIEGRKVVFKTLVGSHNYNLNTPDSDRDYKVFVLPTFDDLYFSKSFNKDYIGETEDFNVHDVRKCSNLWYKANVNFIEVLFSEDFSINSELNKRSKDLIYELLNMKNDIAKMNLKFLYNACIGMHHNKMSLLEKGTKGTTHLVEKYGYDTKQALHSWRILDFLRAFADTDFSDFKAAIWYKEDNNKRKFLLDLKNGKFTLNEFKDIIQDTFNDVECNFKEKYINENTDEDTNKKVIEILKELIKVNL